VLFLHANMHKWDLALPDAWVAYRRRWQELRPGRIAFAPWITTHLGYDLERYCYQLLRALRCSPWWDAYHKERLGSGERPMGRLQGFHTVVRGMDFMRMYQRGWRGPYEELLPALGWVDRWKHWYFGVLRPRLRRMGL
jgi:hypothetical protein